MAVKGTAAKQNVIKRLQEIYGDNFVGTENNKTYIWEDDNGDKVQIAIALTCPKAPVGNAFPVEKPKASSIEIEKEERDEIEELMRRVGLS